MRRKACAQAVADSVPCVRKRVRRQTAQKCTGCVRAEKEEHHRAHVVEVQRPDVENLAAHGPCQERATAQRMRRAQPRVKHRSGAPSENAVHLLS
eukprot:1507958-Rhodomonas_salina.1